MQYQTREDYYKANPGELEKPPVVPKTDATGMPIIQPERPSGKPLPEPPIMRDDIARGNAGEPGLYNERTGQINPSRTESPSLIKATPESPKYQQPANRVAQVRQSPVSTSMPSFVKRMTSTISSRAGTRGVATGVPISTRLRQRIVRSRFYTP